MTSAVFVLRFRAPDLPRPYKTLGYPVGPLICVLVAFWLVVNPLINPRLNRSPAWCSSRSGCRLLVLSA